MSDLLEMANPLDILILVSVAASILVSIFRGGVREGASILALVAGFLLAAKFYGLAAEHVFRITSHQEVNDTVSFLVIFLFVAAMVSYAGGQLTELIKKSKLRGWNVMLGIVLGVIRGVLIACFLVYALLVMLPYDSKTFTDSTLLPYTLTVTKVVSPLGPKSFREDFEKKLVEYRKTRALKASAPKVPAHVPSKPGAAAAKTAGPAGKGVDEGAGEGPDKGKPPEKEPVPKPEERQAGNITEAKTAPEAERAGTAE